MSASLPRQWLDRASEDLEVARLAQQAKHYAHTCFLSQQAAEKALKAFLLDRSGAYPRSHKLVDLLVACQGVEAGFSQFYSDCVVIDQYYIPTRYPDSLPAGFGAVLPGDKEARDAVAAAERVFNFVESRVV